MKFFERFSILKPADAPRFRDALAATEGALRALDAALRAHRGALCDADGARLYRAAGHLLNLKREAAARRSRAKIKRA